LLHNSKFRAISNSRCATTSRQTQIQIINPSHALAAGLSGTVTVYNSNDTIDWGKPVASAQNIATVVGDSTKVAVFGYSSGAWMVNFNAPARRVGLFMSDTSAASNQNNNAWALFDAAIYWATH